LKGRTMSKTIEITVKNLETGNSYTTRVDQSSLQDELEREFLLELMLLKISGGQANGRG